MIIQKVLGKLADEQYTGYTVDRVALEWFETSKKILHKRSAAGRDVVVRRLNASIPLVQDDVIWQDENTVGVIDILPCAALEIFPRNMYEMGAIAYEIGNKHLPLFYEADRLLVPFDQPLLRLLAGLGYSVQQTTCRLLHPLRTSVAPHGHADSGSGGLFSRIMQLTSGNG